MQQCSYGLWVKPAKPERLSTILYWFCHKKMAIVTLSDALLQRLSPKEGVILRDRILCGFCVKIGGRSRTFLIATSFAGQQIRMTLGRWPLVSVEEARNLAMPLLRDCRNGQQPDRRTTPDLPTLADAVVQYCDTKKLRESSKA